jgi:hypothetical protein
MQEFQQPRLGKIYFLVKKHLQFFNRPHTHADIMKSMYDIRDELERDKQENTRFPQKGPRT